MKKFKLNVSKIILFLFLTIVILSIILTNVNSYLPIHTKNYILKINNDEISEEEFIKNYYLEHLKQKNNYNKQDNYPKTKYYNFTLFKQTLLRIINETLLKQYTEKLNIKIDNSYVKNYILNQPEFKRNNKFDISKYKHILNKFKISSNEYITQIKKYLATRILINTIASTTHVPQIENENTIKLLSQGRTIKRAFIDLEKITKNNPITLKIIKNYFIKHKNNFISEEKFKINYFLIHKNKPNSCINKEYTIDQNPQTNFKYCLLKKIELSIINNKNKQDLKILINQITKKNNIHIYRNPWLTKSQILKRFNKIKPLNFIVSKKNFFRSISQFKHNPIKIIITNNYAYVLWINKHETSTFKPPFNINKKIIIKEIINELKNNSYNLFNKLKLKFNKTETFYRSNNSRLTNQLFNIPSPKKNKNVYFSINDSNHHLFIIKFFNIVHYNLSKKEKYQILKQILQINTINIINTIINDLYNQAQISYGKAIPSKILNLLTKKNENIYE